jgi:predicted CopG family antitoxin
MSKKITVSVPDDLYRKMKRWKGRFSYSKIFQKAMSELIEKQEKFEKIRKEDTSMDELISRLKKEKQEEKQEKLTPWYDLGKMEGKSFINTASIDEIKIVVDAHPYGSEIPIGELIEHNEFNDLYFNQRIGELLTETAYGYEVDIPDDDSEEYESFQRGWMDGVIEIWEQIKYRL